MDKSNEKFTILLNVVHLYPAVPTAANVQAFNTNSKLASSITTAALLPPSSNIVLPKREWTFSEILLPIEVDPVNEINPNLESLISFSPIVLV